MEKSSAPSFSAPNLTGGLRISSPGQATARVHLQLLAVLFSTILAFASASSLSGVRFVGTRELVALLPLIQHGGLDFDCAITRGYSCSCYPTPTVIRYQVLVRSCYRQPPCYRNLIVLVPCVPSAVGNLIRILRMHSALSISAVR